MMKKKSSYLFEFIFISLLLHYISSFIIIIIIIYMYKKQASNASFHPCRAERPTFPHLVCFLLKWPWMKSVCWALRLYSSSWACYHMEFSGSQLALFCHGSLAWVGGTRWLLTDTVIIMFNQQITPGSFQEITDENYYTKSSNSIYSHPNWTLWQS